jgi:copper chaperone CopZ
MEQHTYVVEGMSCAHCKAAIEDEVGRVPGIVSVEADVESKLVRVAGEIDDAAVRAAIDEAGYEAQ